jgi:uncharacterized DUF497 family protein
MKFEWDEQKNKSNIKKHSVSFDEAKTIFYSEQALIFDDPDHSSTEDRFIIVGFSSRGKLLLSCFCERCEGDIIRIISARKLSNKEAKNFSKGGLK